MFIQWRLNVFTIAGTFLLTYAQQLRVTAPPGGREAGFDHNLVTLTLGFQAAETPLPAPGAAPTLQPNPDRYLLPEAAVGLLRDQLLQDELALKCGTLIEAAAVAASREELKMVVESLHDAIKETLVAAGATVVEVRI